jgi:hypothetical protein
MAVYFRCYSCNRVWGEAKPLASKVFRDVLDGVGWLTVREQNLP